MTTHPGHHLETYLRADLGMAARKTIVLIAVALFAICALNLWLSFALTSAAHGADLDAPRALEPRFNIDSNSAPRAQRVQSPKLTSTMTIGQCGHLTSARERGDCMVRASGGPWSYVPSATVNSGGNVAMPTVVVSGNSQ